MVKFGITSGDPRPRLRLHAGNGFATVIRVIKDLSDAADLERVVMATMSLIEVQPVRGREYYDAAELPLIAGIADAWLREKQCSSMPHP